MSHLKCNLFFYQLLSTKKNSSLGLYKHRHRFVKKMCPVSFSQINRNTVELNEIMEIGNKERLLTSVKHRMTLQKHHKKVPLITLLILKPQKEWVKIQTRSEVQAQKGRGKERTLKRTACIRK